MLNGRRALAGWLLKGECTEKARDQSVRPSVWSCPLLRGTGAEVTVPQVFISLQNTARASAKHFVAART